MIWHVHVDVSLIEYRFKYRRAHTFIMSVSVSVMRNSLWLSQKLLSLLKSCNDIHHTITIQKLHTRTCTVLPHKKFCTPQWGTLHTCILASIELIVTKMKYAQIYLYNPHLAIQFVLICQIICMICMLYTNTGKMLWQMIVSSHVSQHQSHN